MPVRPDAAVSLASSMRPQAASAALPRWAGSCCSAGLVAVVQAWPEGQELLQAGGGLQGGVQDHVMPGGAGVGFDRGTAPLTTNGG